MKIEEISSRLYEKGLKVTPQRIAILEAIIRLNNHPTAENIIDYIHRNHPNISIGTVYKVLDVLTETGLIKRVKTDNDSMRYDAILENHHHIYCSDSDRIENYMDNELNQVLEDYFRKKKIPHFQIEDIKLQIIGKFTKQNQSIT
jgi:Fur family transcriptional regulator, peroxide stress response regulator